jgi:L-ascorbate metabolism protein UlaG (beta-lactamase superfamily)
MRITYFGHSAFRIETGEAVIILDPFLSGNPRHKTDPKEAGNGATHVLLTHGHEDHTGDAVQICKETGATLVAVYELAAHLGRQGVKKIEDANPGGRVRFADFDCVFTNAWHSSSAGADAGTAQYLGNPTGIVIAPKREKGKTVYVSGDTSASFDMRIVHDLYKPAIGIVCVGDRYTMGADQAAYACRKFFRFKTVIPCHYGTFPGLDPDPKAFIKAMGPDRRKVRPMQPGESLKL